MNAPYIIVSGLDFSPCGDDALRAGLRTARQHPRSELHVVHVVTRGEVEEAPGQTEMERQNAMLSTSPDRVWKRVRLIAFESSEGGIPVHVFVHIRLGSPADAIQQTAVDMNADLVIVGTHGRKGLEKFVLGSVSKRMLELARCPLLIVRPRDYSGCRGSDRVEPPHPEDPGRPHQAVHSPVHTSSQVISWGHHDSNVVPTGIPM